ncbi:MAG: FAD-dependent oxidoreductase [Sphaerochaetaceae bacterium]|mgnify:CR=1 FL=1|jgi:hypothetical protein|nr:FAD-dependent oxidoreductase [Sphaerochaetaceae bacterium]MDD2406991.1 FAD-dependent oxidoreductase [Sphaerochaetaceae bacterium]MDD4259968.1 FAD-dependent oxidoreductase [Sphaerochaetaceae bacterium]MDX9934537.1 FAD-dependent oxidoreductase [Sphaerochaetaceae bacterium]
MKHNITITRNDQYDFVVCGGGPAGFASALSAARQGLKTAVVEQMGCLGGVSTSGGIHVFLGGRKLNEATREHVRVIGGIFDEFTDSLIADGYAVEPNTIDMSFNPFGWYPRMASGIHCDPIGIKTRMEDMLLSAGVRIYYFSTLTDVIMDQSTIESIIVHNKDGFVSLSARCFADCTGDGDLASLCNVPFEKGRKEDGLTTPASVIMVVDNVDGHDLVTYQNEHQSPKLVEIIERLKSEGSWPFLFEIFVSMQLVEKDVFLINTVRQIGVDGTSEMSRSKALTEGRRQNIKLFAIMKQYFPGFANARIRTIYDWIGIRESRRISSVHNIKLSDALNGASYDDCIAATTYNFDLPDPLKPSYDPMMGDAKRPNAKRKHIVIQIPYRSLIPQKVDNLIVAGRCIGCDREVLGPVRIMGPCMQMGQAAGTAAALFSTTKSFKTVDTDVLRKRLWDAHVINPLTLPFD